MSTWSYLTAPTFWAQTAERLVKTFSQAAIALITGDQLGLLAIDWQHVVSVAGLAAVVSVLTSLGSGPIAQADSPSVVKLP